MSKYSLKIILSLLFVVAMAALIFAFSAQDGEDSSKLSGSLTEWLVRRLVSGFDDMPMADRQEILKTAHHIVRKAGHFTEFALLALTLVNFLHYMLAGRRPSRMALIAWMAATLYACTDEFHQMFVASRGPALTDVCIDSAGAAFGALIGMIAVILRLKSKARRASSE